MKLLYSFLALILWGAIATKALVNTEFLDDDGKFLLAWEVDLSQSTITFEIEAETTGYVGFGISPQGSMLGADIFIAGVAPDGTPYSSDRYGIGFQEPRVDNRSDWTLLEAREFSGISRKTYLKFSRLLNTCDDEDYPIANDTNRLIWALGDTDEILYHTPNRRGARSVNLMGAPMPDVDLDKMSKWQMTLDMVMPANDTAYWCSFHKGPLLSQKHHIVGFEALLSSANSLKHTHHFNVYNCQLPPGSNQTMDEVFGNITVDKGVNGDYCYKPVGQQIFPMAYCTQFIYVWAKGGKPFVLPEGVGYPLTVDGPTTQSYYKLEIHYDNPELREGVKFESGVTVYYTDDLRPVDAGILYVGHDANPALTVPPNIVDFVTVGHCSPTCTSQGLPQNGISVFNVLLHAHLSGRKMKLRQFRNGTELPWVDFDDHYDFDYQQNKPLGEEIKILPGDQLSHECHYDSTWKNGEIVIGGLSAREEMCEAFLWYYPASPNLGLCASSYPLDRNFADFGITEYSEISGIGTTVYMIEEPEYLRGSYEESLSRKFNWTAEFVGLYRIKRRYGMQVAFCLGSSDEAPWMGTVGYPQDFQEYIPEDVCMNN